MNDLGNSRRTDLPIHLTFARTLTGVCMSRGLIVVCLCLLPLVAAAAPPVQERQRANGLRILVKPDQRAPSLSSQIW